MVSTIEKIVFLIIFWVMIAWIIIMISLCLYEENKWNWTISIKIKEFFKKYKYKESSEEEEKRELLIERLNNSEIQGRINKIYKDSEKGILEGQGDIILKDIHEFHSKFFGKSEFEPKDEPKKTIFQVLTPLKVEDWKKQPETYRNFLEQANIRQMNYTLRITDEKREASFFRTLKKLETYFSRYSQGNKEKASVSLLQILKRSDIQKRPDIQERIKALIKDA
ncbi:MAG: hypothetical protein ACKKMP_03410 [Candidatus Nealsonbacteria bacterium]